MNDSSRVGPSGVSSSTGVTFSVTGVSTPNWIKKAMGIVNTLDAKRACFEVLFTISVALVTLTRIVSYCPSGRNPKAALWLRFTIATSISRDALLTKDHPDGSLIPALCALISLIVRYKCSAETDEDDEITTLTPPLKRGGTTMRRTMMRSTPTAMICFARIGFSFRRPYRGCTAYNRFKSSNERVG